MRDYLDRIAERDANDRYVAAFLAECKKGGSTAADIEAGEKLGLDTGLTVAHPFEPGATLPVWIANFVLMDYGTGAIFGCPAHDQRDLDFARKYDLPVRPVVLPPGADPSNTALSEVFLPPEGHFGTRGIDMDLNGLVWVPFASGYVGSFDRKKCKGPMNGPEAATGKHCPEGWTMYQMPGPQFKGLKDMGSANVAYYVWVDRYNTLGLGANVPIATGNLKRSAKA